MSTQLQEGAGASGEEELVGDYFAVVGEFSTWYVSTEMARFIEERLDAGDEWIRFVDLSGSRARMRSIRIDWIVQCSVEQRAFQREFFRKLRKEESGGWA